MHRRSQSVSLVIIQSLVARLGRQRMLHGVTLAVQPTERVTTKGPGEHVHAAAGTDRRRNAHGSPGHAGPRWGMPAELIPSACSWLCHHSPRCSSSRLPSARSPVCPGGNNQSCGDWRAPGSRRRATGVPLPHARRADHRVPCVGHASDECIGQCDAQRVRPEQSAHLVYHQTLNEIRTFGGLNDTSRLSSKAKPHWNNDNAHRMIRRVLRRLLSSQTS